MRWLKDRGAAPILPLVTAAPSEREWRKALEEIIERPLLVRPHFQPVVDLGDGTICGYEALARFAGEGRMGTAPAEWFAAADLLGYGPALEALVVRTVLAARAYLGPRLLFLNVSPRVLLTPPVQEAFAAHDDLTGVIVEVTEQTDHDLTPLRAGLDRLRRRGALVAVDDAAAGFASLHRIAALRPDYVKVDGEIVRDLDAVPERRAVVETLVALARKLGARVLAEGVERLDLLDALIPLGVHLGQGFALGRPSPALAELPPGVIAAVRARRPGGGSAPPGELEGLIEPATTLPWSVTPDALRLLFAGDRRLDVVVLVDAEGRPTGLAHVEDAAERVRRPLLVDVDTPAAVAMRRAMERPREDRFDPVVCRDAHGRLAGLVRLERLIAALVG